MRPIIQILISLVSSKMACVLPLPIEFIALLCRFCPYQLGNEVKLVTKSNNSPFKYSYLSRSPIFESRE